MVFSGTKLGKFSGGKLAASLVALNFLSLAVVNSAKKIF